MPTLRLDLKSTISNILSDRFTHSFSPVVPLRSLLIALTRPYKFQKNTINLSAFSAPLRLKKYYENSPSSTKPNHRGLKS
jgi:hypothetical protein